MNAIKLNTLTLSCGKTIEVGSFVYSSKHCANVEVCGLYDNSAMVGEKSIHRFRVSVVGLNDSTFGASFSRFDPKAETIFHDLQTGTVIDRELVTAKEFIAYHS